MKQLKFKPETEVDKMPITEDFFYMLNGGGWIKPEDYLELEDAVRVKEAIKLIAQFQNQGYELGYFEEY